MLLSCPANCEPAGVNTAPLPERSKISNPIFFRGLDLVSHGWLGNAEIFSGLIEIPCFRELKDEFNLLGIQIQSF
jgi:hypothetical protein